MATGPVMTWSSVRSLPGTPITSDGVAGLAGNPLRGTPNLFLGATANPGATDLEAERVNTRRKIDAGAQFLQTQAVYERATLERFLDAVKPDGVAVLTGIIPLKSAKMGAWLNGNVPGIRVPDALLEEMQAMKSTAANAPQLFGGRRDKDAKGVTIEARYTVGEYDILILSAKESDGLETWLREYGYRVPSGASRANRQGFSKSCTSCSQSLVMPLLNQRCALISGSPE